MKITMCTTEHDMTYTDLNPKFLFASFFTRRPEMNIEHVHDFPEIVVMMKGKSRLTIDGKEHVLTAGDVVVLNPGTKHFSPSNHGDDFLECWLGFTDIEYKDCRKNFLPLFREHSGIARLPEGIREKVFYLCRCMEEESGQCNMGRYFMLKSYLVQVLCQIERVRVSMLKHEAQETETDAEKEKRYEFTCLNKKYIVKKIMEYMELHYQQKISLDQIAANMYLSSYYISKLFKSETGDTPINYLISLRMKKAREIMDNYPDSSVQSVAMAVGYEDAYHFSKLFKKYYGLSPLYYKERIQSLS